MDLRLAITQHMQWKFRLDLLVAGYSRETLDPERVELEESCELGRWIAGEGERTYGSNPVFLTLQRTHAEFHRCAAEIVRLYHAGRRAEAERSFDWDFRPVYTEAMRALLRFRNIHESATQWRGLGALPSAS